MLVPRACKCNPFFHVEKRHLVLRHDFVYSIRVYTVHAANPPIVIENPIGTQTIEDLIASVAGQLTQFALVLAVFAIVVVGFKFVFAAVNGDPTGITQARKMLWLVLLGVAIIVSAQLIALAVQNFLQ